MADLTWVGTTSGDFGVAANWIDTSTGSTPGSPPANSDTLRFDRGGNPVTAGLTTGLTGITLLVFPGYYGEIGTEAAALSIACTLAVIRGGGRYVKLTGNQTRVDFGPIGGTAFYYAAGTLTTLVGYRSDVFLADGTVVTNLRGAGAGFDIGSSGTAITDVTLTGGMIRRCARAVTTMTLKPRTRATVIRAAAVTTVNVDADAVYTHASTGNVTTVNLYDRGRFSATGATGNFTITNLNRWGQSMFDAENIPGVTVTVTNRDSFGAEPPQSAQIPGAPQFI